MKQIHILISGYVQGVLFRANIREIANKFGIVGWVRNTENNKVEILAQGDKEKLDVLIEFCKKGPAAAKVTNVEIKEQETKEKFDNFEIKY